MENLSLAVRKAIELKVQSGTLMLKGEQILAISDIGFICGAKAVSDGVVQYNNESIYSEKQKDRNHVFADFLCRVTIDKGAGNSYETMANGSFSGDIIESAPEEFVEGYSVFVSCD